MNIGKKEDVYMNQCIILIRNKNKQGWKSKIKFLWIKSLQPVCEGICLWESLSMSRIHTDLIIGALENRSLAYAFTWNTVGYICS